MRIALSAVARQTAFHTECRRNDRNPLDRVITNVVFVNQTITCKRVSSKSNTQKSKVQSSSTLLQLSGFGGPGMHTKLAL
jgi:hypothetical protein